MQTCLGRERRAADALFQWSLYICACAELSRGYAALGNFTCVECRLPKLVASPSDASEAMRRSVARTMILELAQGQETTAAGYSEYARLEEEYSLGLGRVLDAEAGGGGPTGVLLPRDNPEAFKNFLTWLTLDRDRVRGLESIFRTAGAYMAKLKIENVTKAPEVKAHLRDLLLEAGVDHVPATTATPRMLRLSVEPGGIIDHRFTSSFIAAREKVQFVMEGVGGCRIGEVAGGGDLHGLLSNNVAILEKLDAPSGALDACVVEAYLEHSKTKFSRYLDLAGKTRTTGIECALIVLEYWKLAGVRLTVTMQQGVKVTRPDHWVVRVSLLGFDRKEEKLQELIRYVAASRRPVIAPYAKAIENDARLRYRALSEQKSYINVAVGSSIDSALAEVRGELEALGFKASLVPGPFLIATTGGRYPKLKTMPLSTNSTFDTTKKILEMAHRQANQKDKNGICVDPDPDLELKEGEEPRWTTHSLRRLGDTTARRYREDTGTTEAMIDLYFGWQERVLKKAMQVHYESLSMLARMALAKITGML